MSNDTLKGLLRQKEDPLKVFFGDPDLVEPEPEPEPPPMDSNERWTYDGTNWLDPRNPAVWDKC